MAPSEAELLNIEQARLYLSDDKTVKSYCNRIYRRMQEQAGCTPKSRDELAVDVREHLRRLREYYTGSNLP